MIRDFAGKQTEALWNRRRCRLPQSIQQRGFDKLALLNAATTSNNSPATAKDSTASASTNNTDSVSSGTAPTPAPSKS